MTTENERPDLADEIYLTADEFEHWSSPAHFWADELTVAGTPLILRNHFKPDDPWSSDSNEGICAMVSRAFGGPEPEPEPEVHKLTRGVDAVWTLFRSNRRVIAVNDDGSVAVKTIPVSRADDCTDCAAVAQSPHAKKYKLASPDDLKMLIDPTGRLLVGGVEQTQEQLAMPGMERTIKQLHAEVKAWKKREHERRAPLGIPRLLKRITEALKIYPPMALMTFAEVDARCAVLHKLNEENPRDWKF